VKLCAEAISGTLEGDLAALESTAQARIVVEMGSFTTGDRLKDWKLRRSLAPQRWPTAQFELGELSAAEQADDGSWQVSGSGTISYRGHLVPIGFEGCGAIDRDQLSASATFELDMTQFGLAAPGLFGIKMNSRLAVSVELTARSSG
jgi:hypothetical protein